MAAPSNAALDAETFDRAKADFEEHPNSYGPIRAMMGLLECSTPKIRQWAAKWLWEKCRVRVAVGEDQIDAAPPKAANLP